MNNSFASQNTSPQTSTATTQPEWFRGYDPDNDPERFSACGDFDENGYFTWELRQQFRRGPCHIATLEGKVNIQALVARHRSSIRRSHTAVSRDGTPFTASMVLDVGDGSFVSISHGEVMTFATTPEAAAALAEEFRKFVYATGKKTVGFRLLSVEDGCICTEFVQVQRPLKLSDEALKLHYGDDFPNWEAEWLAQLGSRTSGISILHGPPGCGKTTYLRALMGKLQERHVFYYIPASEFNTMANPALVSFWIHETRRRGNKQKIAIIEDAEELLVRRDDANRDKISNLLNIGDGFLGDHLRIQIIATTNIPLRDLDPALTRAGRLMGFREFPRLDAQRAHAVAASKGINLPRQADYSVAEIYAQAPVGKPDTKLARIGFGR